MKLVLTGELLAKRQQIAKSHNFWTLLLFVGILGLIPGLVRLMRGIPRGFTITLPILIAAAAYAIYRIIQHDNQLCRELGFMCPFCGKPLYESHALLYNTLCPKCKRDIVRESPSYGLTNRVIQPQ